MTQPTDKPKARDDLIFRPLDDEWVVYDPTGKQLHVLNRAAAVVWLYLDGDNTMTEIVDGVRAAFNEPPDRDRLAVDVTNVVAEFRARGMLA